jgi:hypothetical protein
MQRQWTLVWNDQWPRLKPLLRVHHLTGSQAPFHQLNDQVAKGSALLGGPGFEVLEQRIGEIK